MSTIELQLTPEELERYKERLKWLDEHPFAKKWKETCPFPGKEPLLREIKIAEIINGKEKIDMEEQNISNLQKGTTKQEAMTNEEGENVVDVSWEEIETLQRLSENTQKHGPFLAQFIEEKREQEEEQVRGGVRNAMKRAMLSEEEEKKIKAKISPQLEVKEPVNEERREKCITKEESGNRTNSSNLFKCIAGQIVELHDRKNHDYGNAAHESYKEFGIISYVIRLNDKMKRLKSLTKPGVEQQVSDEKIEDTLMDLAAYAIMAIESLRS